MCICIRKEYRFDYTNSVHDVFHVIVFANSLAVVQLAIVNRTGRDRGTNALNPNSNMRSHMDGVVRCVNAHLPLGESAGFSSVVCAQFCALFGWYSPADSPM